jgi:hypothetical protein
MDTNHKECDIIAGYICDLTMAITNSLEGRTEDIDPKLLKDLSDFEGHGSTINPYTMHANFY